MLCVFGNLLSKSLIKIGLVFTGHHKEIGWYNSYNCLVIVFGRLWTKQTSGMPVDHCAIWNYSKNQVTSLL